MNLSQWLYHIFNYVSLYPRLCSCLAGLRRALSMKLEEFDNRPHQGLLGEKIPPNYPFLFKQNEWNVNLECIVVEVRLKVDKLSKIIHCNYFFI